MEDVKILWQKFKVLYKGFCQDEWNPIFTGILVAFFSILIATWWRPWGAVGAFRSWGDWILIKLGLYGEGVLSVIDYLDDDGMIMLTKSALFSTGSVIGIGLIAGAFISACLGGQFAFRFPPVREYIKAVIAGVLMGIGAALAGGCNVGGMYNAIGNLSACGFAMWLANYYSNFVSDDYEEAINSLPGLLLLAAAIGYAMQRGRWCMIQGFREPHMTGDAKLAKSVALSIVIVAIGMVVLKYSVPTRLGGDPVLNPMYYVRGTFGWGGLVGGFIFGVGAMFAGGCGSGTLWRVGEGQIKLWLVVPFFALSNSLVIALFTRFQVEENGYLGKYVYLPDVMGYGPSLWLIIGFAFLWYMVVSWNEESNKLILPM